MHGSLTTYDIHICTKVLAYQVRRDAVREADDVRRRAGGMFAVAGVRRFDSDSAGALAERAKVIAHLMVEAILTGLMVFDTKDGTRTARLTGRDVAEM